MHVIGFVIFLHMVQPVAFDGVWQEGGSPVIYQTLAECQEDVMLPGMAFMIDHKTTGVVSCVEAVDVIIDGRDVIMKAPDQRDQA